MTKEILIQYQDLRKEVKELRKQIESLEKAILRIEDERYVCDTVKGGYGGTQVFITSGFPWPEYSRKKTILYARQSRLVAREAESLEMINAVEEFINNLNDARMRRLLRMKYIEELSWIQVANRMGGKHTEESCRKAVERFLSESESVSDLSANNMI